jgi:glycosyltransferase involved in cell wall biosynthesis
MTMYPPGEKTYHARVSIIILNWNGLDDTIECLESLKRISYPNYEVILIDNGSEKNDAEILRQRFGDYAHVIHNEKNLGFAQGNNVGIKHVLKNSKPDFILLLNNDTVVDTEFLGALVAAGERDPKTGILGPKLLCYAQPTRFQAAGGIINWRSGLTSPIGGGETDKGQFNRLREVDWVPGCALLIKREVIEAMEKDSGVPLRTLKVDGGAVKNNFLMQLQADILGKSVVRPVVDETTALGAAYAAGLAVGFWKSLTELRQNWGVDRTFEPTWDSSRREQSYAEWKKAVDRAKGWLQ